MPETMQTPDIQVDTEEGVWDLQTIGEPSDAQVREYGNGDKSERLVYVPQ